MIFIDIFSESKMKELGFRIGKLLSGGEVIELIGDVGSGKTTLTKGIAMGLGITEEIQSPSFTIKRTYPARNNLIFDHYDFYRLNNAGIMNIELNESVNDNKCISVIEWAGIVEDILPKDRLTIKIFTTSLTARRLEISGLDQKALDIMEKIK